MVKVVRPACLSLSLTLGNRRIDMQNVKGPGWTLHRILAVLGWSGVCQALGLFQHFELDVPGRSHIAPQRFWFP